MAVKKILVPTDFSADAASALSYAQDFAKATGAELLVLHVVEPIYYATPADMYVTTPNLTAILDEQRQLAKEQLAKLATNLNKRGHRCRTFLESGPAAQVIIDFASSKRCNLIIMATHGRTGLAHLLMGSVAERVVRTSSCPVLTVRGKGKRSRK